MAEKLTPQQALAVHTRGGRLLVSAAAGSGKTKVLVDRLMEYVLDPVDPANLDDFLMITYTKAAASELRGKIAAKLTEHLAAMPENRHLQRQVQRLYLTKISTVHSFCGDILREYAYRLNIPADFRVADENECAELRVQAMEQVLDSAYQHADENPQFCAFVDTQGFGRDDRLVPEILLKVYDSARCHLDPRAWLERCRASGREETDAGKTPWGAYLMEDLRRYLQLQLRALEQCAELAAAAEGMDKPAALLRGVVEQLRRLRNAENWDDVVAAGSIDFGRLVFPRKLADPELAERIKAVRSACKKGVEKRLRSFADPSERVMEDLRQSDQAIDGMVELVRSFSQMYDRLKQRRRILDFGDLEHRMLDLLLGIRRSGLTAAAAEIGKRFREILVDEYQDTNAVQDAIFSALTAERHNCFMVGDVKQSIYQFRLADPGIFLEKYRSFTDVEAGEPGADKKVLLSSNFRSCGPVLEAVNDVFTQCMSCAVGGLDYGPAEMLREGVPHLPLGEAEIELYGITVSEDTYQEEAAFAADRIRQLLDGTHRIREGDELRPIRPEDIVILLRSPGSVGQSFQKALEERGIGCCSGGGVNLLETAEIQTLRALLQVISNPRQDIPLLAALASPIFRFTADDLAMIRIHDRVSSVYDALHQWEAPKVKDFLQTLETLRREARMNTVVQLLEKIYVLTRMDSIYGAMPDGAVRKEHLLTFYQIAVDFESGGRRELDAFLQHLVRMEDKGLVVQNDRIRSGCVTLMSIHKSKGLEFPVVFLCGLSREFNRESQRAQVLCDRELGLGLSVVDGRNRIRYPNIAKRAIAAKSIAESVSEELRVLYVAMTRAKDRLIMTYAAKNLEKDLQDLALRLDLTPRELLTQEVICPGEWILLTALQRTEAGAFFALAGYPDSTRVTESPWWIRTAANAPAEDGPEMQPREELPGGAEHSGELRRGLDFRYAHISATLAPSKQTATQLKGREKDQEAAEYADAHPPRAWRTAAFAGGEPQGTAYGSAMHAAMQHLHFPACSGLEGVQGEISRLVQTGLLTREQGEMIRCDRIAALFDTPLGRKLRASEKLLREFKFSVLVDGESYDPSLSGEKILLQGVVDCAILEPDGITVMDFKTDHVTADSLDAVTRRYRPQVQAYAEALSRIYGLPVKQKLLYFFRLNQFREL